MNSQAPAFNLTSDPWIRCLMMDRSVRELSLREVFDQAAEVRRLAGELPTQDYAILRVLLAIVYSSMPEIDAGSATEEWKDLWDHPDRLRSSALEYLDERIELFELFDPVRPFMQVAGLHTQSGKTDGVARLIADIPSGHQYFTTRAGSGLSALSFAEATRWMIHTHAFDPSGIKSGAVGDPRVKGGRGYPIGTGWAGATGGVYFEGANLSETLHLNLDLSLVGAEGSGDDLPVWDRAPLGPSEEERDVRLQRPTGPADVFTWPSRRIRLIPENGEIRQVLVCNGDPLAPQNMERDPLTARRFSKPQTAKFKAPVYMPRQHDPERVVWNGVASLLVQTERETSNLDGIVEVVVPPIVKWLANLAELGKVDDRRVFNARLVGAVYGTQSSVYTEIVDDALAVHLSLLSERSVAIAAVAKTAAAETEEGVWALGRFAGDLNRAGGGDPEPPRDIARQALFFALNEPYRKWVSELRGNEDPDDARESWNSTARRVIREHAMDLIASAGGAALVGRTHNGGFVSAATAETWLTRSLIKHLPLKAEISARLARETTRGGLSSGAKGAAL